MTTIKIYNESNPDESMEVHNDGEFEPNQLPISFDFENAKELLWFNLSKEDARNLIIYLKKQFNINP